MQTQRHADTAPSKHGAMQTRRHAYTAPKRHSIKKPQRHEDTAPCRHSTKKTRLPACNPTEHAPGVHACTGAPCCACPMACVTTHLVVSELLTACALQPHAWLQPRVHIQATSRAGRPPALALAALRACAGGGAAGSGCSHSVFPHVDSSCQQQRGLLPTPTILRRCPALHCWTVSREQGRVMGVLVEATQ
eukprot:364555-Chlamydomonas_euryale.AAC.11